MHYCRPIQCHSHQLAFLLVPYESLDPTWLRFAQDQTTLFTPAYQVFGSMCGFGPDLVGIRSVSLAPRYRTAASWSTLIKGLEKIQAARMYDLVPIFTLSSDWVNNS